jgi:hypothetical protein
MLHQDILTISRLHMLYPLASVELFWGATCRAVLLKVDLRDIQVGSAAPLTKKPGWWFIFVELDGSRFINARYASGGHPFDGDEALTSEKIKMPKALWTMRLMRLFRCCIVYRMASLLLGRVCDLTAIESVPSLSTRKRQLGGCSHNYFDTARLQDPTRPPASI